MILESIVTSVDTQGRVNIAPMGPRVDWNLVAEDPIDRLIHLRPFDTSQTYRNLCVCRAAVIHVTDDAWLFARAAMDALAPDEVADLVQPIPESSWWTLRHCHRWFAVEVESIDDSGERVEVECRILRSKMVRPFFGFNRAKHAVIEAAILATRTHLLPAEGIQRQLQQLQPLVDKTGGPSETTAFEFLRQTIGERIRGR